MTAMTDNSLTVCGFCCTKNHDRCAHAVRNGNHGIWLCTCAEPNCGGKILSCIRCKRVHDDVAPDTRLCIDRDGCNAYMQNKRDANPAIRIITRVMEKVMTDTATKTEAKAAKTPAKPKTGTCNCGCKGTTKGGNFLPGHDARWVSEQVSFVLQDTKKESMARKEIMDVSESLANKFDKSLGLARDKTAKSKAAEKARQEKKAEDAKAAQAAKAAKAAEKATPAPATAVSGKVPAKV